MLILLLVILLLFKATRCWWRIEILLLGRWLEVLLLLLLLLRLNRLVQRCCRSEHAGIGVRFDHVHCHWWCLLLLALASWLGRCWWLHLHWHWLWRSHALGWAEN